LDETDTDALLREIDEELGVKIRIGERIGPDVLLPHGKAVLRIWLATLVAGEPVAFEHADLRWLAVDELDSVDWLPADMPIVEALREYLAVR
jgi:8-oxo-dGTP diphosphatase